MDMLLANFLSWWYGRGWRWRVSLIKERLLSTADYFSFGLLIQTLFSPFRQISAGQVEGSLETRWRAFVDRLLSRFIGAFMRTLLILIGIIAISLTVVISLLVLILWAVVPVLPIAGILLAVIGWFPS